MWHTKWAFFVDENFSGFLEVDIRSGHDDSFYDLVPHSYKEYKGFFDRFKSDLWDVPVWYDQQECAHIAAQSDANGDTATGTSARDSLFRLSVSVHRVARHSRYAKLREAQVNNWYFFLGDATAGRFDRTSARDSLFRLSVSAHRAARHSRLSRTTLAPCIVFLRRFAARL